MSPRLQRLSRRQVVRILEGFGFRVISQRGSHAKLRREGSGGEKETLTIPLHDELDPGTLRAIFSQGARYVPREQLREHFYSD